ncbi:MAG: hypothetical protein C5B49_02785 [Bdellovibrio sp.]|nr:MAG: hypothetical protein C5B49_02785 [Bdellovibrio sp.]
MIADKIQYFENIKSEAQLEFLQAQNHCSLCGSALILEHEFDASKEWIWEKAHCPECQIRNRNRGYQLH